MCVYVFAQAWKLEFEASATVGFKLAFCYLKCKDYVLAVDVCEAVLAQVISSVEKKPNQTQTTICISFNASILTTPAYRKKF